MKGTLVPVFCDDLAAVARTTMTSQREPTDPDDDDIMEAQLLYGATSTVTKASGDTEGDPDDEDIVAMAGTTTLTESGGDHESDPDEDDVRDSFVSPDTAGTQRPILYRFGEKGYGRTLNTYYDENSQVSLLRSGESVVSALLGAGSKN